MKDYIDIDYYNLISSEGNIKDVELDEFDQKRLHDMKVKLYEADRVFKSNHSRLLGLA
ncbi:hypothetical protein ACM6Q7_06920 [Peribacillus butanolivorans]|uniref:hypothetical protein n=1 Tax=Peribacillus butanolivorans TaxID=421767 RepID=UPI0039FD1DA1